MLYAYFKCNNKTQNFNRNVISAYRTYFIWDPAYVYHLVPNVGSDILYFWAIK